VTPGSLRDHARGHPEATGNYVSAHVEFRALDPHAKFWDVARAHAANLASPASQRGAREGVGALAWVPKAGEMVSADRTGREAFIAAGYASATPYPSSMELSNPGLVQETLPGVRAVLFSQTPGAGGHPLNVNVRTRRVGCALESLTGAAANVHTRRPAGYHAHLARRLHQRRARRRFSASTTRHL
jgi:hypothetical protein